jgi:hypothetical protein
VGSKQDPIDVFEFDVFGAIANAVEQATEAEVARATEYALGRIAG